MTRGRTGLLAVVAALLLAALAAPPVSGEDIEPQEEHLSNGLTVILEEDHQLPLVAVWCWYRLGAGACTGGQTGVAHWIEHLTFRGAEGFPGLGLPLAVEAAGGAWDAYTSRDATGYVEVLPAGQLELALRVEAARMKGCTLAADAVRQERRALAAEMEEVSADPLQLLSRELASAAFQAHPYMSPLVGWPSDIEGTSRDDLASFYAEAYRPQNAVLAIAGDFQRDAALSLVKRYFGAIPRTDDLRDVRTTEPEQRGERRVTLPSPDKTGYVGLALPVPNGTDADFATLLLVDALLAGPKSGNLWLAGEQGEAWEGSRLHQALVASGLARWVRTDLWPQRYPTSYTVAVAVEPGVALSKAEGALRRELQRAARGEFTADDLERARMLTRTALALGHEGPARLAHQLGYFETIGDLLAFEALEDRVAECSLGDLKRVATRYFPDEHFTVVTLVPSRAQVPAAGPGGATAKTPVVTAEGLAEAAVPEQPRVPAVSRPGAEDAGLTPRRQLLKNGLTVYGDRRPASPTVALQLSVEAGYLYEPAGKPGLARLAAELAAHGSHARSGAELRAAFAAHGARLRVACGPLRASFACEALGSELPALLGLMAEVAREPAFTAAELDTVRGMLAAEASERSAKAGRAAEDEIFHLLLPPDRSLAGEPDWDARALGGITSDDVLRFYREHYSPRQATLVAAGDLDELSFVRGAEAPFAGWAGGEVRVPSARIPGVGERKSSALALPAESTVTLIWGCRGPAPGEAGFEALELAAALLGSSPLSGRLTQSLVWGDKVATRAAAEIRPSRGLSVFLMVAEARPADVARVLAAFRTEREKLGRELLSVDEVSRLRAMVQGRVLRDLDTNAKVAALLAESENYDRGGDYAADKYDRLRSVTPERLRDAARRYLTAEAGRVVAAGPISAEALDRAMR